MLPHASSIIEAGFLVILLTSWVMPTSLSSQLWITIVVRGSYYRQIILYLVKKNIYTLIYLFIYLLLYSTSAEGL